MEDALKQKLTPEQYHVLCEKGTEAPFTGKYYQEKASGMYACAACGNELFPSDTKFDSGSGWPSFWAPAKENGSVVFHEDQTHDMARIEVTCAHCGGHLGHVFDDGPREKTGKRFCINSCVLELKKGDDHPVV